MKTIYVNINEIKEVIDRCVISSISMSKRNFDLIKENIDTIDSSYLLWGISILIDNELPNSMLKVNILD